MKNQSPSSQNHEHPGSSFSGWFMLFTTLVIYLGGVGMLVRAFALGLNAQSVGFSVASGIALLILGSICTGGFFTLQPNTARVLILFGAYTGTIRASGFHWTN